MTGLRRYADAIAANLAQRGVDIQVRSTRPPVPEPVSALGRRLGWDISTFLQSYPVWESWEGADVYHLASENLATSLAFRRVKPCVVTVHGFFGYLLRDNSALSMYSHRFDRWFDSLAARGLRSADLIIAVSSYVRDTLIQRVGVSADRIHVIPEAIDHTFFRPQQLPDAFREKHGLSKDQRYVLYVGSEQPRKNFLTLLRAFAKVRQKMADVRLIKVGQPEVGAERQKAIMLIRELGIERDVVFYDHAGADLPLFYNVADAFVFPSLYEGFGFPPLEAMACGTPVICSNRASLPEVVGDAGLTFDPTDENELVRLLELVLANTSLSNGLKERGLKHSSQFNWSASAESTLEVYSSVLSSLPHGSRSHNPA